ncbi:pyruvate carboxyltransferase [Desulfovibrio mangrovi]|uniref:LeuA family protein n=1 Tax=Desulfovibrio mangrovi TaxID=2976983 RepID=UPI002247F134|nr:pyruvate carboxyltransferase [Desulfovibrio mangrovi]UZP68752.1 pyruvate carboxyltransferase [Desulfovibrio mangrovi]
MLIDTTLREGAQLFGAYFRMETREDILSGLLRLGVDEVEVGWVGQEGLEELVRRIRHGAGETKLSVWSPCRSADIRTAATLGVDRVNIGIPVSDAHMGKRLGLNRKGLLEKLGRMVLSAGLAGINYVSVGLEDVSRADRSFALDAALLAQTMGASRIRLADSLGVLSPRDMCELVAAFRMHLDIPVAVHCHNDFGMATANAVSALQSGATFADVSVLGIGERSGIAATEELAAYMAVRGGDVKYRVEYLRDLCALVAGAAGVDIPRNKAVAGADIFACESGLHAHALSKSPELFEPYDPALIGADRKTAVGGKSGRAAVSSALGKGKTAYPAEQLDNLVASVRRMSWELGRPLTPNEFTDLADSIHKH